MIKECKLQHWQLFETLQLAKFSNWKFWGGCAKSTEALVSGQGHGGEGGHAKVLRPVGLMTEEAEW